MRSHTGVSGEDAETVVPEAAGHQEAAVDGGDETVGAKPHFLGEVVTQVTAGQVTALIGHRRCESKTFQYNTQCRHLNTKRILTQNGIHGQG